MKDLMEKKKKTFVCNKCFQGYTSKQNLVKHGETYKCEKNIKIQKLIMENLAHIPEINHIPIQIFINHKQSERKILFDTIPDDFYDVDYEMEEFYENTKGYIYVIRTHDFSNSNKNIYVIGHTLDTDIFEKINQYPDGSELLGFFM